MMLRRISEVPASMVLPRLRSCWYAVQLRGRTEQRQRQLGQPLVGLGPVQLGQRPLGAGHAGLHQLGQRAVVGVAQPLQVDPQLCHPVTHQRVVGGAAAARVGLTGQADQLVEGHLQAGGEGEAERPTFMQQGRHRHPPALPDLADEVLAGHADVGEEDLVELRVAGDLPQRPHLDAVGVHVHQQVGEALVAL
jgi:hypothetical protein